MDNEKHSSVYLRKMAVLAALLLVPLPGLSTAGTIDDFEGGAPEAVAELNAPGCSDIINITLPAECHILKATMDVSAMLPDRNNPDSPEAVQVFLEDTLLWEFNGTDYGAFGVQDRFINGTAEWKNWFDLGGGENSTCIRLPKKATVKNATLEINCSGRELIDNYVNLSGDSIVSEAGDVNGDGCDDVIMGVPYDRTGTPNIGRAYLFFGGPAMNGTHDVELSGEAVSDYFGFSVSAAGDVNGDGYDDVIAGAPGNDAGGTDAGRAYLFFGGPGMDTTADVVLSGSASGDNFGWSVSGAGDQNGDGYDDVVVGAPYNDSGGADSGRAYLFFGASGMDGTADVVLTGAGKYDYFGDAVSGAGDVNGDGYDDVVIGAYGNNSGGSYAGRAYVYLGGAALDGTADVVLTGEAKGDSFGDAVSDAGDVNADGYDDVIVGAYRNDENGIEAGRAYIFLGGASMDMAADVIFDGEADWDRLGEAVSGAGDVNNDGYGDVVLGARGNDAGGTDAGRAYLIYGGPDLDSDPELVITGPEKGSYLGSSVSAAGDLDGDGYDDFAVGVETARSVSIFKSMAGIKNAAASVGQTEVWANPRYSNGTNVTSDFGPVLDRLVKSSNLSGEGGFEIGYVDLPVQVMAQSRGNMSLGGLRIGYSFEARLTNLGDRMNEYIGARRTDKAAECNISIPIRVVSRTPGRLGLDDLSIIADLPPEPIGPIPDVRMAEDSFESELLDLSEYFKDDYDPPDQLRFTIASASNASHVRVGVFDKHLLSADALYGPANDNWTGELEIVVEAADRWNSRRLSDPFRIVVTNINDAPMITSRPPFYCAGGQQYLYQVVATDIDSDTLTYALASGPKNMTINASSGLIRWVPQRWGMYEVAATASDGALTATQKFTITVANRPPKVTRTAVPAARVNEHFSYRIQAVDDDNDTLSFSFINRNFGPDLDPATGIVNWTPEEPGDFPFAIGIFDGHNETRYDFTISVAPAAVINRAPWFWSAPVTTATVDTPYIYEPSAIDPDGDNLTFLLEYRVYGMTIDPAAGRTTWTPYAAGNFTVALKASDGRGGVARQEFKIRVQEAVRPQLVLKAPRPDHTLKGNATFKGTVTRGTREVSKVQLRIDGNKWTDAAGRYTWHYELDTRALDNGRHSFEFRAYDGKEYSDTVKAELRVDNPAPSSKGFLPMMDGLTALALAISMTVILALKGKRRR